MSDLNNSISQLGYPDAVINFNGNDGLIAGIWGFKSTVFYKKDKIFVNNKIVEGKPLKILQETLNQWSKQKDKNDISAVGYLGYDFKKVLYPHINFKTSEKNIPDFWFGNPLNIKIFKDFSPINLSKSNLIEKKTNSISKQEYFKSIKKIKYELENGNVYQVNKTYPLKYKLNCHPFEFYSKMSFKVKPRRGLYLDIKNQQFCSFSPEEFIKVKANKISTYPMKGTRPEGSNEIERKKNILELSNSEKDKAEHLMIVDLLRNDLGKICEFGTVKTKNLYDVQTYETVHHMVTEVCGRLNYKVNFIEIIKALFPGGSITGAPKESAMKIIDSIEKYSRGIYTGSMGYLKKNGDMDFNIAIRTITVDNDTIEYPVGGGIVWDSKSEEEWIETKTKSKILELL